MGGAGPSIPWGRGGRGQFDPHFSTLGQQIFHQKAKTMTKNVRIVEIQKQ